MALHNGRERDLWLHFNGDGILHAQFNVKMECHGWLASPRDVPLEKNNLF